MIVEKFVSNYFRNIFHLFFSPFKGKLIPGSHFTATDAKHPSSQSQVCLIWSPQLGEFMLQIGGLMYNIHRVKTWCTWLKVMQESLKSCLAGKRFSLKRMYQLSDTIRILLSESRFAAFACSLRKLGKNRIGTRRESMENHHIHVWQKSRNCISTA